MSKPNDIPQDVWDDAANEFDEWELMADLTYADQMTIREGIARLIIMERNPDTKSVSDQISEHGATAYACGLSDAIKAVEEVAARFEASGYVPGGPETGFRAAAREIRSLLAWETDPTAKAIDAAMSGWFDISEAKKDGSTIWAALRPDIFPLLEPERDDLKRWNGVQVPLRHPGIADDGFDIGWGIAAPVGQGGFPDNWIAGWRELPADPA